MKTVSGSCLLLAAICTGAPALAADPGADDCSKNHYILDGPIACWQDAGSLQVARLGHTATLLLDGRVLVAGGGVDGGTSVEMYDPAKQGWALAAPLHVPRHGHTATLLADGTVLVLGGNSSYSPSAGGFVDDTGEIYDPLSNQWTPIPGPITPRTDFSATRLLYGRVLVAGGIDALDQALGSAEIYDPATKQWTQTGSLSKPAGVHSWVKFWTRWGHTATLLTDGRVLMAGGFDDDWSMNVVAEAELYDPATGAWTQVGPLSDPRGWHTANLLPDGRVMVAGGEWHYCPADGGCGENTLGTTEIYDPATRAWSPGPPLSVARSFHTSTLRADGSLLAAGGTRDVSGIPYFQSIVLADTEAAEASAYAWAPTASLRTSREGHTATLLEDGSVLVVGGAGGPNGLPLASAEIYRIAARFLSGASFSPQASAPPASQAPSSSTGSTPDRSSATRRSPAPRRRP